MKIHIRDIVWLIVLVSMGLAWWQDGTQHRHAEAKLQLDLKTTESSLAARDAGLSMANRETSVLCAEVRRLRGLVQASLEDQREWFELEVQGKKLVAIRPGTTLANTLTLDTVERIETETGLEATRLRHFLSPISELRLDR